MALLFSHPNSVQSKMTAYSDVGKGQLGIRMLCKFTASVYRGFPKSSVQWISPHAPQCFRFMKGVNCKDIKPTDVPIIICALESMKSVLDRALGTDNVYRQVDNQLGEAMTEFFSSVFYLALDSSSATLYKTGFSELAKHPDALRAIQSQRWFDLIKRRLFRRNPEIYTEIFACDLNNPHCMSQNGDPNEQQEAWGSSQTLTEQTAASNAPGERFNASGERLNALEEELNVDDSSSSYEQEYQKFKAMDEAARMNPGNVDPRKDSV